MDVAERAELKAEVALQSRRASVEDALASLSPEEARKVTINDNALIQQLREELCERSSTMRKMFEHMDVDGSGQIDVFEFRKGLQKAGFTDHDHVHHKGLDRDAIEVTVEDTVRLCDAAWTKSASRPIRLVLKFSPRRASRKRCPHRFNYFDKNHNGYLSYSEFVKLLQDNVKISYKKSKKKC